jgi:hypothetical protein
LSPVRVSSPDLRETAEARDGAREGAVGRLIEDDRPSDRIGRVAVQGDVAAQAAHVVLQDAAIVENVAAVGIGAGEHERAVTDLREGAMAVDGPRHGERPAGRTATRMGGPHGRGEFRGSRKGGSDRLGNAVGHAGEGLGRGKTRCHRTGTTDFERTFSELEFVNAIEFDKRGR